MPSLDERVDDLLAVMDAAGSEQAVLFGISEGGPMGLLTAATHPERVRSLVLYGVSPRFSSAPGWAHGWTPAEVTDLLADLERSWGEGALLGLFAPAHSGDEQVRRFWGRVQRAGASPAMARAVLEALAALDCRDILPAIQAPTLILQRQGDRVARVEAARFMAGRIPGAQLVEFPGEDHLIVLGEFEPILDAIERFVIGSRPRRPSDRILVTVLTTALADERTPVAALGVGGRQEMLERHHAEICGVLARHGGREVRTPGGGAVATFAAPSRAIACARAIRRALSALGLTVRAGIHTGECDLIAGEVNGPAVDVSEAVARAAGPDEVLITGTVRDLVPGTEATLTPHPMRELPGIPGRWLLLSVDA